jgi:hypothetical protein
MSTILDIRRLKVNRNSDTVLPDFYLYVCHRAKHKMNIKINKILTFRDILNLQEFLLLKKNIYNSSDDFGVGTLKSIS